MKQESKQAVVLIAEDDREMRSLLCDELFDLGVSIREAADGDEALRSRLMIVLTDSHGPSDAGWGLDYTARPGRLLGVPMVLITPFGDHQTVDALAMGVEAYFDKPVRLSELKKAVRRLLGPALDGEID
jgi:CheY-like chemotaxis protein